jgi:hypothetical protein
MPGMKCSGSPGGVSWGIEFKSASVYGWLGRVKRAVAPVCSTICPAYITTTSSATSAITPRSWVTKIIAMSSSACNVCRSSTIWAWVVTSRAVVGSSAMRSLGEHDSAIAIITRWRMPPENAWG